LALVLDFPVVFIRFEGLRIERKVRNPDFLPVV
jgi:hypothetical protein